MLMIVRYVNDNQFILIRNTDVEVDNDDHGYDHDQ